MLKGVKRQMRHVRHQPRIFGFIGVRRPAIQSTGCSASFPQSLLRAMQDLLAPSFLFPQNISLLKAGRLQKAQHVILIMIHCAVSGIRSSSKFLMPAYSSELTPKCRRAAKNRRRHHRKVAQRPFHWGLRFSLKARGPSWASSLR